MRDKLSQYNNKYLVLPTQSILGEHCICNSKLYENRRTLSCLQNETFISLQNEVLFNVVRELSISKK